MKGWPVSRPEVVMGRPKTYETPEELEKAVEEYFNTVPEYGTTVTGLALWLGFDSRQSLYDYEKREEFSYIVKRAKLKVEMGYELKLMSNACTGAIFALKNMGWRDKTETDITTSGEKLNQIEVIVITGKDKHSIPPPMELNQENNG